MAKGKRSGGFRGVPISEVVACWESAGSTGPHHQAAALGRLMKGSAAGRYEKLIRDRFGMTVEEFIVDRRLALLDSDKTPENTKERLLNTLENIRSFEDGKYPHLAPSQVNVKVQDNRTPSEVAGIPVEQLAAFAKMSDAELAAKFGGED